MSWLVIAILAYLIFAVVFLVDKYLLTGPIPSPKVYAFYVGVLEVLILAIIPFVGFYVPAPFQVFLSLVAGGIYVLAILYFFRGLQIFEPSRIVPAVGGLIPIFSLFFVFLLSKGNDIPELSSFFALFLLVIGTILITYEKKKIITLNSLKISVVAALLFGLHFVLIKYVYIDQSFWNGFIWIRIGGAITALLFLFSRDMRESLFKQKIGLRRKTAAIFISNQVAGAGGGILQNWAIALAPLASVSLVPALQGTQYVFLLAIAAFISFKFPRFLKEKISRDVLLQKIIAILLIGGGLVLISL